MDITEFLKCGDYVCKVCRRWKKLTNKAFMDEAIGTCSKSGARMMESGRCMFWASEDGRRFVPRPTRQPDGSMRTEMVEVNESRP